MHHINEVATWFKKNNILKVNEETDNLRLNLLCIYTKVAYNIKGLELVCNNPTVEGKKIELGITNTNLEAEFTEEELQILKTINREYGYLKIRALLYYLTDLKGEITFENITNHLNKLVSDDLEGYKLYKFNERPILVNDKVFFVDNNMEITEELIQQFEEVDSEDQYIYTVFESDMPKGPVIY